MMTIAATTPASFLAMPPRGELRKESIAPAPSVVWASIKRFMRSSTSRKDDHRPSGFKEYHDHFSGRPHLSTGSEPKRGHRSAASRAVLPGPVIHTRGVVAGRY